MAHKITDEEIKALQNQVSRNRTELPEPEYEEIKGYQHLDVFRSERGYYRIELDNQSLETSNVISELSKLNSFLEEYNLHGNIHRAYRKNYTDSNTKAKNLGEIIRETNQDLTEDLEKLAEELDPT